MAPAKNPGLDELAPPAPGGLAFLADVSMKVCVEFARTKLPVKRVQELRKGSVIELDKIAGEPLEIRVNGKLMARGEAVIVNDRFGIRVTEIMTPDDMDEEDATKQG
jgi:flagellar motor switch protein FliN/FliY